ncbi:MAG TPA: class I SAM-dependent methyltransferase [Polyangiales bacterium]|nr:class I SAM-dependent methyltransferase [Polyangiales bacterium]
MQPLLYRELVPWYQLLDPREDHADEVAAYQAAFERANPEARTLLELGAGAGNNASHLKQRYRCTLSEPSREMQALSLAQNPDCEHLAGDMRTVRFERTFDLVLVHDAIMYMTDEAQLRAAIETAFVHTREGGAAVFAPDVLRENFRESTDVHAGGSGARSLRCLEWVWDPDPGDSSFVVEYAFLLREGGEVQAIHDRHVEGMFTTETWLRLFASVGFRAETFTRPIDDRSVDTVFLCRR